MIEDSLINKLRERGLKVTPQRRAILEALRNLDQSATALEVWDQVRRSFPDMSLDTVYRNLNMLTDIGMIGIVNLRGGEASRFEMERGRHHHHLICLKCGDTVCLEFCPIDEHDVAAAERHGYKVVGHAVELYGYCPGCK
ncbi:MAG TPA: transcriptional repressor [Firmicutes bacterium]|nr:transcriptional repressor [Bacillota bacterium]